MKATEEVFKRIVVINNKGGDDSIPHSDTFVRETEAATGIPGHQVKQIINILRESHRILVFEIEQEDKENEVGKVEGYVEADPISVRKLKQYYNTQLETVYEKENGRKLLVNQIIREIFPYMQKLRGTPVGTIANKAIMLAEYEKLLERNYEEFTHEWKEAKFHELMKAMNEEGEKEDQEKDAQESEGPGDDAAGEAAREIARRASDSPDADHVSSLTSLKSINRVLNIYGVDFFFRVNIRNYNFDVIRQVIEKGVIDQRKDILKLKDMLSKVRAHYDSDSELPDHEEDLVNLERSLTRFRLTRHL